MLHPEGQILHLLPYLPTEYIKPLNTSLNCEPNRYNYAYQLTYNNSEGSTDIENLDIHLVSILVFENVPNGLATLTFLSILIDFAPFNLNG